MPATYTLISSNVLTSSAASVTFSSIPATYTDLVLRCSVRNDYANPFDQLYITLNSDTGANYSYTALRGSGTAVASFRGTSQTQVRGGYTDGTLATSNTFSSDEIYIPNYTSTSNKPISVFGVQEDNASGAFVEVNANLWQSSSAITSISIASQGASNFLATSSFYLYGIKNS
jgi:hypothetical protein